MQDKAQKLIEKYEEIEHQLGLPEVASDQKEFTRLNKVYKSLEEAALASKAYLQAHEEKLEWQEVLDDGSDPEMVDAAKEELNSLDKQIADQEEQLQFLLIPKDPYDLRNVTLEIRAGTGGDESSLFAGDLMRMYTAYADSKGWRTSVVGANEGTVGGFKEVKIAIEGESVYGALKFESGVHRVQRVPATESQGRVHTSAATVAVLPEADEMDEIEVRDADLKVDTYRASGAGGQHVNKTDSAIRITHYLQVSL